MNTAPFTIKSGGTASWAIRIVLAAALAGLALWIPTSASNGQ